MMKRGLPHGDYAAALSLSRVFTEIWRERRMQVKPEAVSGRERSRARGPEQAACG